MSDAISIKIFIVAAALGTMTSVALAQPMKLTNAQMDQVAAGIAIWTEDAIRVSRMPFRGKPTDMVAIGTTAYNFDDI